MERTPSSTLQLAQRARDHIEQKGIAAFTAFRDIRRQAGLTAESVRHPVDDDAYVVIDLEFDTDENSHAFFASSKHRSGRRPRTPPPSLARLKR